MVRPGVRGRYLVASLLLFVLSLSGCGTSNPGGGGAAGGEAALLNVSYDPTRELYQDFNKAFTDYWKEQTGQTWWSTSRMAGRQAGPSGDRGLQADVVGSPWRTTSTRLPKTPGCCPPIGRNASRTTVAPTPRRSSFWSGKATRKGFATGVILSSRAWR